MPGWWKVAAYHPSLGTSVTASTSEWNSSPGRWWWVPCGTPIQSPCSSEPRKNPSNCQCGRSPHLLVSQRMAVPGSMAPNLGDRAPPRARRRRPGTSSRQEAPTGHLLAPGGVDRAPPRGTWTDQREEVPGRRCDARGSARSAGAGGEPADDVLVAGARDPTELVDEVRVEADEDARLPGEGAVEDDLGGSVGRHLGELLLEERVDAGRVEAGRLAAVAADPGADATGVDAGDRHRVAVDEHLLADRLGQPADGVLRGVVRRLAGHRHQPEERGDVDQGAVAARDEVGQELLGAVDDAPEVDADDPVEVVVGEVGEVAGRAHAGVVDDEVDATELLDHAGGPRCDRCPVRDVDDVLADLRRAGPLGERDGLGEAVAVPVGQGEEGARACAAERKRTTDPRSGTGDDDDLVGEGGQAHAAHGNWRLRRRGGQDDGDRGVAGPAVERHGTAVGADDRLDERQPQAGAAPGAGGVAAGEPLERAG